MTKTDNPSGGDGGKLAAVTVRVVRGDASRLEQILAGLKEAGLRNVAAHKRLMIVNGDVDPGRIEELRKVGGVASVREDKIYRPVGGKPKT